MFLKKVNCIDYVLRYQYQEVFLLKSALTDTIKLGNIRNSIIVSLQYDVFNPNITQNTLQH